MKDLLRETPFGTLVRLVAPAALPYPEEEGGFVVPDVYRPRTPPSLSKEGEEWSGATTLAPTSAATPKPKEYAASEDTPHPDDTANALRAFEATPVPEGMYDPFAERTAHALELAPDGTVLVTWYGPDDPSNPQNWSLAKKVWAGFVIMYYTFAIYAGSSIVAFAFEDVAKDFGVSTIVAALLLTLFVAGYAVGPLFLAPLSEIASIGRNPPYIVSMFIFCVLQVPSALTPSFAGLCVLRFLAGFMGSPPLATGGASLTDIFSPQKAGYALGAYGVAVGVAPAIAPMLSGFAIERWGWEWAFWEMLMIGGLGFLLLFFGMPETNADTILYKRAARLRALTRNDNLRCESEILDAEKTFGGVMYEALARPLEMTVKEPIVLAIDLYVGLTYAILYSYFESYPLVFHVGYGWSLGMAGLPLIALTIGGMLSYVVYCIWSIKVWEPQYVAAKGRLVPEAYLPLSLYGAWCYPICLFWFAWSANRTHWASPMIASGVFGLADCWSFMPYLNYLCVAYPKHAASALASNDFVRSMMGAAMPIVAYPLFHNLGIDWGNSVLGFASVAFLPIPFLLYYYGPALRARSPMATHIGTKKDPQWVGERNDAEAAQE
jgi:DHA1 family multidrug resistance protein-like MFS transporter